MRVTTVILYVLLAGCTGGDIDDVYKGRYFWGAEVDAFHPCGTDVAYWVSASSWVKSPLNDYLRSNTAESYQPVYIEFRGHLLNEEVDGFARDYDGLIRISEVLFRSVEIPAACIDKAD